MKKPGPRKGKKQGSGQNNSRARLTNDQVKAARMLCYFGTESKDLARDYGIAISSMDRLLRGSTYKDAGGPWRPAKVRNYTKSK